MASRLASVAQLTHLLILACLASLALDSATAATANYPLKKSVNGRYLVDASNVPYMIVGDSPQALMVNLSEAEADGFFADRQAHGFNTVWINLLCTTYTGGRADSSTFDGIVPFSAHLPGSSSYDLGTPNEAYFAHVDRILQLAAGHGLLVMLDPIETGGYLSTMVTNDVTACRNYGRYLGDRYKNFDNIIWMSGNDFQDWRTANYDAVVLEVARGIQDNDTRHMHTVELDYPISSSLDDANWAPLISLNVTYTYSPTYARLYQDYARESFQPNFLGEARYELEGASTQMLRKQEYWSMTSGATGQVYGNRYTWQFISGWQAHLDTPGSTEMAYLAAFFAPRAWYDLVPDVGHAVLTAGYGTFSSSGSVDGNDYATAASTPDGSLLVIYTPVVRSMTVNLSGFSDEVIARWYDPTNGTYVAIAGSPFANSGSGSFTPPGNNSAGDGGWVLVLETQNACSRLCLAPDACHESGVCDTHGGSCIGDTRLLAPAELETASVAGDRATYTWSALTSATDYDVVRGSIGALPAGLGGDEVCFENLPAPTLLDDSSPPPGTGYWYLARGENACGAGTYGSQSDASLRITTTCQGSGVCAVGNQGACPASDQCHLAGTCDVQAGSCSNPAKASGVSCTDGNACTSGDVCGGGACLAGPALICDDNNVCSTDSCNPATGCVFTNNANPCDDGNACTSSDTCGGGVCGGAAIVCNDNNPCTTDSCDPVTGCVFTNNTNACDDGNACTSGDVCEGGACLAGPALLCDDNNLCTTDSCNPATGCVFTNNTNACDDGNACTFGDVCAGGTCLSGAGVVCNDGNVCTTDTCNPATGCIFINNANACDDGNACTQRDACQAGACLGSNPVVCFPSDQCHDVGVCDPASGVCSDPEQTDGTACSDGNACTQTDSCQAGICTGSNPVVCNASDQCHSAGLCDTVSGACSNPTKPDGSACGDGNGCTQTDTCEAGVCTGTNPVVCPPSDPCHVAGVCNVATGVCSNPIKTDGSTCDDGNACTQTDSCQAGVCAGANLVVCVASDSCHDAGLCDPASGLCSNPNAADGTTCDDGDACTSGDACTGGACGGSTIVCNDGNACTTDACNPATGCVFANNTNACDDGNACTAGDACAGGTCQSGAPVVCNDGNVCTTDSCNPATGCVFTNNTAACDDGNACTTADTCGGGSCHAGVALVCNDGNACTTDACNPATGCIFANNANACDDGNACTAGDSCAGGTCQSGAPVVCNDSNPCTTDTCTPATGCVFTNNANACDDGNACTTGDTCGGGTCHAGAALVCNDGNTCTTDSCNPATGCVFTNNTNACDDGNACTQFDSCSGGVCVGGNPVACTAIDSCHSTGACNPASGVCSNPAKPSGASCDDGNACTVGDACNNSAGCVPGPAADCDDGNACTADTCDTATGCVHGDVNLDANSFSSGRVDGRDLVVLADAWNTCPGNTAYDAAANLDQTGCVDLSDFHLFMMSFGRSCP